jgi:hypothetical protein
MTQNGNNITIIGENFSKSIKICLTRIIEGTITIDSDSFCQKIVAATPNLIQFVVNNVPGTYEGVIYNNGTKIKLPKSIIIA